MHWDGDVRGLIRSHLKATLKHLLCLEYSTVAIQNKAMDDFLAGPETHLLHPGVGAAGGTPHPRDYPDAVILPSATELPPPSGRVGGVGEPKSAPAKAIRLVRGILHNLTKADPAHHERPQLNVPTQDSRWFLLCNVDGVTVTTADGRGVVYRQRDRRKDVRHCWRSRCAGSANWPADSTNCAGSTGMRCRCCRANRSGSRCCLPGRAAMADAPPPRGEVAALVAVQSAARAAARRRGRRTGAVPLR